jgi:homoaconitase/3-isopropylmalate dehydratase large subunit
MHIPEETVFRQLVVELREALYIDNLVYGGGCTNDRLQDWRARAKIVLQNAEKALRE